MADSAASERDFVAEHDRRYGRGEDAAFTCRVDESAGLAERASCPACGSSDVVAASYQDFDGRWDGVDLEWQPAPITVPAVHCLDCGQTRDV